MIIALRCYNRIMAETYTPNDSMAAAGRRAIKWKEEGKAKGAGTMVGWTRARQLANGAEALVSTHGLRDKPTVLALREIAAGKVGLDILNRKTTY